MRLQEQQSVGVVRVGVAVIVMLLLGFAAWTLFGGIPYQMRLQENADAVVTVVDQFMVAGLRGDTADASSFVQSGSGSLTPETLNTIFQTRRELFDDYQSVSQENYGLSFGTTFTGTRAELTGNVSYTSRPDTSFQAKLLKRNNQWRLEAITFGNNASVQPNR